MAGFAFQGGFDAPNKAVEGNSIVFTRDSKTVTISVAHLVKAGAVTDADFAVAPPDGTVAVDSQNNRVYVRVGGTWKYAALT